MLDVFNTIIGILFVGLLVPPCYIYVAGLTVELIDMSSEKRKEFALELFESVLLGIVVPAMLVGIVVAISFIISIPLGGV